MKVSTGDIVRLPMVGMDGEPKPRPAVVLCRLPGRFQTWLMAGISTSPRAVMPNWDIAIDPSVEWWTATGLERRSAIRLSYLQAVSEAVIIDRLGTVPSDEVTRLQARLSRLLLHADEVTARTQV